MVITGNSFLGVTPFGNPITIGVAGYQGSAWNSNIVVSFNTFSNTYTAFMLEGGGQNSTVNAQIYSNTANGVHWFASGYGWGSNVAFFGNTSTGIGLQSGQLQGQWFLDDFSNQFPPWQDSGSAGQTNMITYANGMRQQVWVNVTNSIFALDDTHPLQMPPGAMMIVANASTPSVALYPSASLAGSPLTLTNANTITFAWTSSAWLPLTLTNAAGSGFVWTNNAWLPAAQFAPLAPPLDLRVIIQTN